MQQVKTGPVRDFDYAMMIFRGILEAHDMKRTKAEEDAKNKGEVFSGVTWTVADFLIGLGQ